MVEVNEAMGFRPVARLGDFQKRLTDPELVRVGPDEWETFRDVRLAVARRRTRGVRCVVRRLGGGARGALAGAAADVPFMVVATLEGRGVGVVSGAPGETTTSS